MTKPKNLQETIRLIPEKWVSNGFTIGHHQDKTVFVTGGIPGKEDEFIIEKKNSQIIYARASQNQSKPNSNFESETKSNSDCEAFPVCGGCSYRHIPYEEEIRIKKQELLSSLRLDPSTPIEIITGKSTHYRNNVQWKVSGQKIGFHSRFSNQVVDLRSIGCKNLDPLLEFPTSSKSLNQRVSNGKVVDYTNSVTELSLKDKKFQIPPKGFQQINTTLIPDWILYIQDTISKYSRSNKKMDCLELFCGSGIIGQSVSENINTLFGIEAVNQSITYARKNASINHLEKFTYKALDLYKPLSNSHISKYPLWILNPPRSGAGNEVVNLWKEHLPGVVVYSSCDSQTLARDWKMVQSKTYEYKLESLCMIDFFPRTKHFEVVAVFVKKDFQEIAQE
ncbi:MAG: class I SAM-dependent RNA methyltransferase [Leptospira sp.]|nr:class I SAM-dependent RNA methyltransferase [Leptospira sp.]